MAHLTVVHLPQENWFNYGAASEKWIPPERRLHARSEYRDMEGKRDVPFHWNPAQNPVKVDLLHATIVFAPWFSTPLPPSQTSCFFSALLSPFSLLLEIFTLHCNKLGTCTVKMLCLSLWSRAQHDSE